MSVLLNSGAPAVAAMQQLQEPMAGFALTIMGDPVLKEPARDVTSIADLPYMLIPDMKRILAREKGLGLAAQQVGSTWRVALLKLSGQLMVAINLRIIDRSAEMHTSKREGCLSVQGNGEYFRVDVQRHARVTIEYRGEDFAMHTLELEGLDAVIAQHEADHLDGKCIVDGLCRQQRRRAEQLVRRHRS